MLDIGRVFGVWMEKHFLLGMGSLNMSRKFVRCLSFVFLFVFFPYLLHDEGGTGEGVGPRGGHAQALQERQHAGSPEASGFPLQLGVTWGPGLCFSTCPGGPFSKSGFPDARGWVIRQEESSNQMKSVATQALD